LWLTAILHSPAARRRLFAARLRTELEQADWQQDQAAYYEQQARHAQAGDYEAAKEDAANAAWYHGNADYQAGGEDHSGQARLEEHQMDWAVWEEGNADYYTGQAEAYAAQGDYDHAATYAAEADQHQAAADYHGDLGEHGGPLAVYDPSSEITHDASDDYSAADYSSGSSDSCPPLRELSRFSSVSESSRCCAIPAKARNIFRSCGIENQSDEARNFREKTALSEACLTDLFHFDLRRILPDPVSDLISPADQDEDEAVLREILADDAARIFKRERINPGKVIIDLAFIESEEIQFDEQPGQLVAGFNLRRELTLEISLR